MNRFSCLAGALLLWLAALTHPVQAQAWLWAKDVQKVASTSNNPDAWTTATAVAAAGDSYAAYQFITPIILGGQVYGSSLRLSAALAHLDTAGTVTSVLLTGRDATIAELRVDAHGNVYAAGRFHSSIVAGNDSITITRDPLDTLSNRHRLDYFVGKWNAAGTLQWLRNIKTQSEYKDNQIQDPVGLGVDDTGRVVVAGCFTDSVAIDGQVLTSSSLYSREVFAAQFDSTGQLNWIRSSASQGNHLHRFEDLAVAADGSLYLTGSAFAFSWGSVVVGNAPDYSNYWLKLNASGQHVASHYFEAGYGCLGQVAAGTNGVSYLGFSALYNAGMTWDTTLVYPPGNNTCFFVLQLDPAGIPQWVRAGHAQDSAMIYLTALEAVQDLAGELPTTRLYVGGSNQNWPARPNALSCGAVSIPLRTVSSFEFSENDGFILRLDGATGTPYWMLPVAAGNRFDGVSALSANLSGDLIVAGSYGGQTAQFGSIQLTQVANSTSGYLARLVESYNLTQGTAYTDTNANAFHDAGESGRAGLIVEEQPSGHLLTTNSMGEFSASSLLGTVSYHVPTLPLYHTLVSTGPASQTFSTYHNVAQGQDFALQPVPNQQDIRVLLTLVGRARPGFPVRYRLTFENVGTVGIPAGTLALSYDPLLIYRSNTLGLVSQTSASLTWSYANLLPGESRDVDVEFLLATTATIGYQLLASATLEPISGDLTPPDNTESVTSVVTASFDPNEIEVNHPLLTPTQVVSATRPLDYIVRFENVGTDTAFTVTVRDTLPGDLLKLSTLQLLSSSHPCSWKLDAGGMLTLRFSNIQLPYTRVNATGSQGFARFRVVPRVTLALGDVIPNRAAIYFDFNPPVTTNTALTTVRLPGEAAEANSLEVWPNPVHDILYVRLPPDNPSVSLFDATGRQMRILPVASPASVGRFDLRGLPAGLYVLRAGAATRRVVVR